MWGQHQMFKQLANQMEDQSIVISNNLVLWRLQYLIFTFMIHTDPFSQMMGKSVFDDLRPLKSTLHALYLNLFVVYFAIKRRDTGKIKGPGCLVRMASARFIECIFIGLGFFCVLSFLRFTVAFTVR